MHEHYALSASITWPYTVRVHTSAPSKLIATLFFCLAIEGWPHPWVLVLSNARLHLNPLGSAIVDAGLLGETWGEHYFEAVRFSIRKLQITLCVCCLSNVQASLPTGASEAHGRAALPWNWPLCLDECTYRRRVGDMEDCIFELFVIGFN